MGLRFQFWFLDDGILCGRADAVAKALQILRSELPKLGLSLNVAKCKIYSPACYEPVDELREVPHSPEGSAFLGVPIGDESFVQAKLTDILGDLRTILKRLGELDSPLVHFVLLRSCPGTCKMVHLLRLLDFSPGR